MRVTCNLPADGLQYTDYAWGGDCKLFEYINIRGINCSDCTAYTRMDLNGAWFVNSFKSKENECDFDGSPEAVDNENNFGRYRSGAINTNHRCSSLDPSTTQYWFGVKHE